jgi:thioredoxin reductase
MGHWVRITPMAGFELPVLSLHDEQAMATDRNSATELYDVIVVGGGPAGLSAALMLGRCRRRVIVVDSGTPRNAAAKELHGFLGQDGITPHRLLKAAREQLARYDVSLLSGKVMSAVCCADDESVQQRTRFAVTIKDGTRLVGRKLLFATGCMDRLPDIPGLRECYGVSVHHCPYCDGWEHRGRHLLAYAEQNPKGAAGLGLALRTWSDRVTILSNGSTIADEDRRRLLRNGIRWNENVIVRLNCDDGRLRAVEFEGSAPLEADALFFESVQHQQCDLPESLGCGYADDEHVRTTSKQRTTVRGIFFAGDADGDVQFAIVAAAEGATAAVAINRELQDEDRGEVEL